MTPFIWTWEEIGVRITASRFHQERGSVSAECVIERRHGDIWKRFTSYRLSLTSVSGRREFIRDMNGLWEGPDWVMVAHQLCDRTLAAWRGGEPPQVSTGETPMESDTYILNPLLYAGHTTLLYGPGDSGKSVVGVFVALLLRQGGYMAGLAAAGGFRPLTLDWERSYTTFDSRVKAITRGHPELSPSKADLIYQRLHQPLADCIEDVEDALAIHPSDVLIVDSLGMASGGDLNAAESATRFFDAIRTLEKPAFVIGHTHKAGEDKTIYGSVYFYNLASVVWEAVAEHEEESHILRLGLFCRKNNLGPRPKPMGLSLAFTDDQCAISEIDLTECPALSRKLSRAQRIIKLLADHLERTVDEIAEALEDDRRLVGIELNKSYNKGKRWLKVGEKWAIL